MLVLFLITGPEKPYLFNSFSAVFAQSVSSSPQGSFSLVENDITG